jgi:hypothetical protein
VELPLDLVGEFLDRLTGRYRQYVERELAELRTRLRPDRHVTMAPPDHAVGECASCDALRVAALEQRYGKDVA